MSNLKNRLMNPKTGVVFFVAILVLVAVSVAYTAQDVLTPVDSLIVVDANGKKVGNVVNDTMVAFKLDGFLFLLNARPPGLYGTGGGLDLYFESSDCSGTPYLLNTEISGPPNFNPPSLIPSVAVNLPSRTLYIPDPNTGPLTVTPKSIRLELGQCDPVPNYDTINARLALPTIDLDTVFTPPFKLQAGPKNNGNGKGKDK